MPEINETITIEASPEQVFRALTEAEAMEGWLATRVESDPQTSGHFRYEFEFDDASQNNAQEGEPWDGARERFTGGWQMFLNGLKRYVETGEPARPLGIRGRGR